MPQHKVEVFHVFTATALPSRVVSSRENFLPCPSGFPHGSSTSTGGNASTWRFSSSATEKGMSTVQVFFPFGRAKYNLPRIA
ncbi:hypothetical protein AB0D57_26810 [Streptomyces sp. NPDC048275]|uniref:hypothetical protein n=1 Tax=Streptomyces sp. NPDC048275 TaxID=3155629 RepID=UPI0033FAC0A5